jgi:hypothetical protein
MTKVRVVLVAGATPGPPPRREGRGVAPLALSTYLLGGP